MSRVSSAVGELYSSATAFLPQIHRCEMLCEKTGAKYEEYVPGGLMEHFKLHLRATLHSQMPAAFTLLFQKFYAAAFKVFYYTEIGSQGELKLFSCMEWCMCVCVCVCVCVCACVCVCVFSESIVGGYNFIHFYIFIILEFEVQATLA
ncbi:hypothetical protein E2C01_098887 [Portunus trituberculatus]|uniref:Uncharacterized protein n=1 Tax=Portunus trituberculatus TaxID=210409 RepID=A0A5B7K846_PORTR|nr:hypothetical protein [Portunus trituberculatus]